MNKKTLISLFATTIALTMPSCRGNDKGNEGKAVDAWTEQMNHNLADLTTHLDNLPYTTAMSVYNLSADSFLFNYHERQQMIPASTLKLLTAICALENLGMKGEFHTTLHQNGTVSSGTLHGDLIIVGGFDPLLSLGDLQSLAHSVKSAGITRIDGRIIGDVSMTDTLRMGNGWSWDDYPSPVAPYLTPLFFDHQRIKTKTWNMIANSDMYCLRTFANELQKAGVSVNNERLLLSTSGVSPRGKELSRISHTLSHVLPTMLKDSDNLYAEAVFYRLASLKKKKGASAIDGVSMVKNTLTHAGCDNFNFRIVDGSGLSPYDNMTAESQIRLLIYAYNEKILLFSPLYSSLAVAGKSGTLSMRMTDGQAYNRIHAKTGTSANACCLTGFAKASNGDDLAFAILSNGVLSPNRCRAFQDEICKMLCQ